LHLYFIGIPVTLNQASSVYEIGVMLPFHFTSLIIAPGIVFMNNLPKCASSSIDFALGNLVLNLVAETI
jgi:hypothetical protein